MVKIARSDDMRHHNRKRILTAIRRSQVASRTDISAQTKLSAATVSAITSDLLDEGILSHLKPGEIEASGKMALGRGRPKVALEINADAGIVCSVYVQLNHLSASIFDYAGELVSEHSVRHPTRNVQSGEIKAALISCIEGALKRVKCRQKLLQYIEVGFQGVTDVAGENILWTPICNQTDMPVKQWLESKFGVSAHVANDCDMIAQALNWRNPVKYGDNFATVLLAHGVGMGLFLRGGIINGTRSSGVEFGHMSYIPDGAPCRCGNRGCIEAYAGDYAIYHRAQGETGVALPPDMHEIPDLTGVMTAAKQGDEDARAAIEAAGAAIGTGLASLFAIVDAFPVILVGRGATLFELMEPAIRKALETAPGGGKNSDLEVECFPDERPLVREGCTMRALLALDDEVASRRHASEAAE
jgi:predicted NBD/HSP70 family sugar kinase